MSSGLNEEQLISQWEVFGYTQNDRKDPVYKNKIVPVVIDSPDPYHLRRLKAIQIQNQEVGDRYGLLFDPIPSKIPPNYDKDYTYFEGVIVPKIAEPKTWEDYDLYTSRASHYEIFTVANNLRPERWPDPAVPLFSASYVKDKISDKRLLIADFRRTGDSLEIDAKMEAVLRVLKPSYYFMRQGLKTLFAANKFIESQK